MSLNELMLFSNVKITRDYSTVHDMDPEHWYDYLTNKDEVQTGDPSPPGLVYINQQVNYYRLPQTIRIEHNYELLRDATYGVISMTDTSLDPTYGGRKHIFFWVDAVRMVKQHSNTQNTDVQKDVVELDVTPDVWSNRFTECELYDSYIERRHVDRWVYQRGYVYYPNAGDSVGGAYVKHMDIYQGETIKNDHVSFRLFFMIISITMDDGSTRLAVGGNAIDSDGVISQIRVHEANVNKSLLGVEVMLAGNLPSVLKPDADHNLSVDNIKGVFATPWLPNIHQFLSIVEPSPGYYQVQIDTTAANYYTYFGSYPGVVMPSTYVLSFGSTAQKIQQGLTKPSSGWWETSSVESSPIFPGDNGGYVYEGLAYDWLCEPAMFMAPASKFMIITSMGSEIATIPDIMLQNRRFHLTNIFDFNTMYIGAYLSGYFETEQDIAVGLERSNIRGCVGMLPAPSLPVTQSAWKEYQAIQKTGDDIAYNTKQVQTAIGMITGALGGAAIGSLGLGGNPVGSVAGALGGVASGAVSLWSNSENLRAKHETIKNTPGAVMSGTGGLGAYLSGLCGIHVVWLHLDDVSFDKLKTQYYYFGYNVRAVTAGTVNTKTRKIFDYIETRRARIRGRLNAEDAAAIADVFNRGVRIYHDEYGYKQIGTGMSLENYERGLPEVDPPEDGE